MEDGEAFEMTRLLATREGVFVGMSSGAAVAGAVRIAAGMDKGNIVVILPDRGDRYLSTTLFRSVCAKCPP
jgi:cysteine synthase B